MAKTTVLSPVAVSPGIAVLPLGSLPVESTPVSEETFPPRVVSESLLAIRFKVKTTSLAVIG